MEEIYGEFPHRYIYGDIFDAVCDGNFDKFQTLLPKLEGDWCLSFNTTPRCSCGYKLELISRDAIVTFDREPVEEDDDPVTFNRENISKMLMQGQCCCSVDSNELDLSVFVSLLHMACYFGHLDIVKKLIESGADVCSETSLSRHTPLQMAVYGQKDENIKCNIVRTLLKSGANASQSDSCTGGTLLHICVDWGYNSIIDLLLEHNCNIDTMDSEERTALHHAIVNDRGDIVRVLVSSGANVNLGAEYDPVPLVTVIMRGAYELVSVLLCSAQCHVLVDKPGGDKNFSTVQFTALHVAIHQGLQDIVSLLLDHNADIDCVDQDGNTALMISVQTKERMIFRELVTRGADVNKCNKLGYAPIHYAAWDGEQQLVDILLLSGCSYDTRTSDGNTPLALACHGGHKSVALTLLNLSVNVNNSDRDQDTPLHYAAYKGCVATCRRLVELGADPNARNRLGATPLWNAVYKSSREGVKFLLELNVSMSVPSCGLDQESDSDDEQTRGIYDEPHTPLYVAYEHCRDHYIAAMLIISGVSVADEKWLTSLELPIFHNTTTPNPHVELIRSSMESPQSLKRLCRNHLRSSLGLRLSSALPVFEIPAELKDYLMLKDELNSCETGRLNLQTYKFS